MIIYLLSLRKRGPLRGRGLLIEQEERRERMVGTSSRQETTYSTGTDRTVVHKVYFLLGRVLITLRPQLLIFECPVKQGTFY